VKALIRQLIPRKYRPHDRLKTLIDQAAQGGIATGPFKGMRYGREAVCGELYPKLLGTYESELHSTIEWILQADFRTIVDIGAAEGYYACGLARAVPRAKVIAFEANLKGRYLLARNITLNSLEDRIRVRGFCDAGSLQQAVQASEPPVLIICDAEGHEYDLLSPSEVPGLQKCWILAELHEFALEGITELIKQRFSGTHNITEFSARQRERKDFPLSRQDPYVKHAPFKYIDFFLSEKRPPGMNWLWMLPKHTTKDERA